MKNLHPNISKINKYKEEYIIDCHAHIGLWRNFMIPWNDAEGMVEVMDEIGINKACVSAHIGIGPDFEKGNQIVAEIMEDYPERFLGYVTINPGYTEIVSKELEKNFSIEGFVGIKLHPDFHNYSLKQDFCRPIWEYADHNDIIILSHTWESPDLLNKLASNYSNIIFIVAHAPTICGFNGKSYIELAQFKENIYLDITSSTVTLNLLEQIVEEVGSEKILYGSDIPFVNAAVQFGNVVWANISDKEKTNILGGNYKNILEKTTNQS